MFFNVCSDPSDGKNFDLLAGGMDSSVCCCGSSFICLGNKSVDGSEGPGLTCACDFKGSLLIRFLGSFTTILKPPHSMIRNSSMNMIIEMKDKTYMNIDMHISDNYMGNRYTYRLYVCINRIMTITTSVTKLDSLDT